MDDLYEDLDNYDEVNAVQELRNENLELKVKLEEHAAAMEKLQKDYDTLEMEFKKLENNYSSLLKTARSEIERKSQRISQLNMEKDMMVLSAIKNGKNIKRHFNKSVSNTNLSNNKPNKWIQNKKVRDDDAKLKNIDTKNERSDTHPMLPKNKAPNSGIDNRSDFVNKFENTGDNKKKSNAKENIPHEKSEQNYTSKTLASSIRDRRKSMSAVSLTIEKFSSDEEHEHYITKDTRTDLAPIDKFERKNANKIASDRYSNKTSESSSIDDRGSNYHESRDKYRGRSSRQYDNSFYRGRDKYEVSLKYRTQYSPDRAQKRQHREYKDDYNRQEQGRYRTLESPPRDSSNRHYRRNPDSRSNYDRHSYDSEKNRHRYEEKYPPKYQVSNDYNEPHTKRQKIDSFPNPDDHFMEDKRYYNDNESTGKQSIPEYSQHEHNMLRLSCQSPDYVHTDAAFTNPVKEIMATAATPQEDPRVTSKRYIIKKENGKETLSTAVGKNIDIKSVDKVKWNIESVNIPAALVRRPSQCSEDFVKDIYMDMDNPDPNRSMESGEVYLESEDENEGLGVHNKTNEIEDFNKHKQAREKQTILETNLENTTNIITTYRIPKIGQSNTQSKVHVPTIDESKTGVFSLDHSKINVQIFNESKMNNPLIDRTAMTDVPMIEVSKNTDTNDVSETKQAKDNIQKKSLAKQRQNDDHKNILLNITKSKKESQNQITLSKMAMVADDLELSDENSDNADSHGQVLPEKFRKHSNVTPIGDSLSKLDTQSRRVVNDNETEKTVDTVKKKTVEEEEEKPKESDSSTKQKSKKRRSKSKEASKDLINKKDGAQVTEKKIRSKKDKEAKPKETKQKFSDLFGDSSSLMTPEDLGIPTYIPISEDAQDVVDMKINQIIDTPVLMNDAISDDRAKPQSSLDKKQEVTTRENILEQVRQKSETEDKEVPNDIKKKKSSKRKEEKLDNNEISTKVIYENLNPGTDSNETDVVKTVIISTGVQPDITFERNVELTENHTADVEIKNQNVECNQMPSVLEFKKHDILKALATSTPQKEFSGLNSTEPAFITGANNSKIIEGRDNLPQPANETDTKTLDSHDAPDVRIFVKRRRKLVKRPPMT